MPRETGWSDYRVYGLNLHTNFTFINPLPEISSHQPDLTVRRLTNRVRNRGLPLPEPLYRSPEETEHGESSLSLYRLESDDLCHIPGVADYFMQPEQIEFYPVDLANPHRAELNLLGPVLSIWLEQQSRLALHASAIVASGEAAVFLSSSYSGKSVLAAALVQDGHALLTDDILCVTEGNGRWYGHPGYPQMRMWPAEADHFLGSHAALGRVDPLTVKRKVPVGLGRFGTFHTEAAPLTGIYLPERRDAADQNVKVEIAPVAPRTAMIELVRNSFAARVAQALGLQEGRIDAFARLLQQVPVKRLVLPSGLEHLPAVRDAVLENLASL